MGQSVAIRRDILQQTHAWITQAVEPLFDGFNRQQRLGRNGGGGLAFRNSLVGCEVHQAQNNAFEQWTAYRLRHLIKLLLHESKQQALSATKKLIIFHRDLIHPSLLCEVSQALEANRNVERRDALGLSG